MASLFQHHTFRGNKGIYSRVWDGMWKVSFQQSRAFWRLTLATRTSRELTARPNCIFCPVVLQLSWPFNFLHASHVWHFGDLPDASQSRDPVTSQSRDPVTRWLLIVHTWSILHTFSHITLILFSHKYKVSTCWIKPTHD